MDHPWRRTGHGNRADAAGFITDHYPRPQHQSPTERRRGALVDDNMPWPASDAPGVDHARIRTAPEPGSHSTRPSQQRSAHASASNPPVSAARSAPLISPALSARFHCIYDGCDETFSRERDIRRHIKGRRHKNEGRYVCRDCEAEGKYAKHRFNRLDGMRSHVRNRHQMRATDEALAWFQTPFEQRRTIPLLPQLAPSTSFGSTGASASTARGTPMLARPRGTSQATVPEEQLQATTWRQHATRPRRNHPPVPSSTAPRSAAPAALLNGLTRHPGHPPYPLTPPSIDLRALPPAYIDPTTSSHAPTASISPTLHHHPAIVAAQYAEHLEQRIRRDGQGAHALLQDWYGDLKAPRLRPTDRGLDDLLLRVANNDWSPVSSSNGSDRASRRRAASCAREYAHRPHPLTQEMATIPQVDTVARETHFMPIQRSPAEPRHSRERGSGGSGRPGGSTSRDRQTQSTRRQTQSTGRQTQSTGRQTQSAAQRAQSTGRHGRPRGEEAVVRNGHRNPPRQQAYVDLHPRGDPWSQERLAAQGGSQRRGRFGGGGGGGGVGVGGNGGWVEDRDV